MRKHMLKYRNAVIAEEMARSKWSIDELLLTSDSFQSTEE